MSKIPLIIKREYLTRVKKKSFIVMTILGPILMASLFIIPFILASVSEDSTELIQVVDETMLFDSKVLDSKSTKFVFTTDDFVSTRDSFDTEFFSGLLYIPKSSIENPNIIKYFSSKEPNLKTISYMERTLGKEIEKKKLAARGIATDLIKQVQTRVNISTLRITDEGDKESSATLTTIVGFAGAILIYFFIFFFGAQVMRGVIEEKTSRILEVIISSVKPFQLMMGKIIGIALVGLTQFLLWVTFTFLIVSIVSTVFLGNVSSQELVQSRIENQAIVNSNDVFGETETAEAEDMSNQKVKDILGAIGTLNFPLLIGVFIFYFLGGYLLYGSLFAAIGAAVDNETDTQQFMLPITIPLILAMIVAQTIIVNPNSTVAMWFSLIPFTSPVVMMVRIPFEIPFETSFLIELIASMLLLIIGFIFTVWLAAKIYRTGILMYGKKVSYEEIAKWLFYKN
ncbi:MAG: ABC transporter permease [Bacteroidia bacterium]|nr:ABC transporter permease [Bacteroidia bacterium]NNM16628.1 ABC transporter permease [Bacteroidia bacterium]